MFGTGLSMSMPDLFRVPSLANTGTNGYGGAGEGVNPSYYNYLACLPPPLPTFPPPPPYQQQRLQSSHPHSPLSLCPYTHGGNGGNGGNGGPLLMQGFTQMHRSQFPWMAPSPPLQPSEPLPLVDSTHPSLLQQHPQVYEESSPPLEQVHHETSVTGTETIAPVVMSRPTWTPKVPLLCTPSTTDAAPATAAAARGNTSSTSSSSAYCHCNMCEFDFEQSDAYQGDCLLCPGCRAKKIVRLCLRVGGRYYAVWGRRGRHVRNLSVPEMEGGVLYMVTEPVDSTTEGIANAHSSITLLKIDHGGDLAVFQLFREYVMTSRTMSLWSNDRQELFVEEYAPKVGRATTSTTVNRGLNPFYQFKVQLILPRGKYGAIMNAPLRFFTVLPSAQDHPGSPPRTTATATTTAPAATNSSPSK